MNYDPFNWYWLRDDGAIYSSATQSIVSASNSAHKAWVKAGGIVTRWPVDDAGEQTDAAMLDVVSPYGLRISATPIDPSKPPTPPVTKRQLRLALVRNGIALSAVEDAIAAMPEGLTKEEAQIEWADASTFNRTHPTLLLIAGALGITEEQVDAMWAEAITA